MKSNNFTPPKYRQYSSRLKEITRWQVIRLKEMGYKNSFISNLIGISSSTVSTWHKKHLDCKDSSPFNQKDTLTSEFGKLLPDELRVLSFHAIQLIESDVKRSKIAEILGLSSGAVVSGWLNKHRQEEQKKSPDNKQIIASISSNKTKQKNHSKTYNNLTKRMKSIVHWQIIRLKQKGYETSYISDLVKVNKSLISNYWKSYKKENSSTASLNTETIIKKFGSLSIKEKEMLLSQIGYLENDGIQRSEIAKIIGLSSGAVISGWYQEKIIKSQTMIKKEDITDPYEPIYKKLSLVHYRSYQKETKKLVRWQALYLINKGYKYSEASTILRIHASTVSRWWKSYQKTKGNKKYKINSKLTQQFKKLTPEMKRVLSLQIITLKRQSHTHKKIAYLLALKNASLVTRWLKKISLSTNSNSITSTKTDTLNIPQIGLTKESKEPPALITKKSSINSQKEQPIEKIKKTSDLMIQPLVNNEKGNSHSTCFSNKDNNIELKIETRIIKAKDYAHYFEAEKLIELSKDKIIQSKKEALEIKAEAEKSAEQTTQKIIETAKKKARKEADELLAEKNIAAVNSATEYLSSLQKNLPEIIMTIINKFINNYDDRDFVIQTINSAISEINNKEKVKIHVNSKVIDDVKKRLNDIDYPNKKITLISDKSLGKKDCLVVTKLGVVNANLESQIKKIEENINTTSII